MANGFLESSWSTGVHRKEDTLERAMLLHYVLCGNTLVALTLLFDLILVST